MAWADEQNKAQTTATGIRESVHWPGFRGPSASGVAEGFPTPLAWDAAAGKNIAWKTPVPGLGHSSPAVWGDRVFITTAVSSDPDPQLKVGLYGDIMPVQEDAPQRWQVLCLDKNTGKILWEQTAHEGVPKVRRHPKSTHANSTPATDGRHVVAFFGSEGLYCYDIDGRLLWSKDFGVLDSGYYVVPMAQWAFGSSPVIHDGKVLVQCDVQKGSFLAAFDVTSGTELWRTPRDEVPTWSTPTVHEGRVITNGYRRIGAYDLKTGEPLWWMRGGGDIPVPTPVVAHGLVFITNAHGSGAPIYAIRPEASGDLNAAGGAPAEGSAPDAAAAPEKNDPAGPAPAVAWFHPREGAYMQTPLVYGDLLYNCRDNGVLSCYDAKTGKMLYRERLGGGWTGFTASPVAGDGKIYFTSEQGETYVVAAGPEFKLLATNTLGEICMATPALSEGMLLYRTERHLVAIKPGPDGEPPAPAAKEAPGSTPAAKQADAPNKN